MVPDLLRPRRHAAALFALFALGALGACDDHDSTKAVAEARPVRTTIAQRTALTADYSLVGEIRPHFESDLGFKIGGKVIWRTDRLGARVARGEVVARLDDQDQRNQLTSAQADLAAAQATLTQATAEERRQDQLRRDGWATQARYEAALQARQSAEAQMRAAQARLDLARDQRAYTELRAPEDTVITALGAEAGQVVGAGQMVARLARLDRKDAVFAIAEAMLLDAPPHPEVEVHLLDDPAIVSRGPVTELSPSADPVTRTYTVKVALPEAPAAMRFGMTVVGRLMTPVGAPQGIVLPSSALFQQGGKPAVWVVDPTAHTVSLVAVEVARVDPDRVVIAAGLDPGAIVVTAGVQALVPGQAVRLVGPAAVGGSSGK